MSEYVTHLAVLDDCRRLALADERTPAPFERTLKDYHEQARMGSSSRGNHVHAVPLLTRYRSQWRDDEEPPLQRLAYVLGWFLHRAADTYFKPRYPEDGSGISGDAREFHDAVTFEEVYDGGEREPFARGGLERDMRSHPASSGVDIERVEGHWRGRFVREYLRLQGLPDPQQDVDAWAESILEARQVRYKTHEDSYEDPDPDRWERVITKPPFYDPEDPLIQFVRRLQVGNRPDQAVETAVESENDSQYAEALQHGYRFFRAVCAYWRGDIRDDEMAERCELTYHV